MKWSTLLLGEVFQNCGPPLLMYYCIFCF